MHRIKKIKGWYRTVYALYGAGIACLLSALLFFFHRNDSALLFGMVRNTCIAISAIGVLTGLLTGVYFGRQLVSTVYSKNYDGSFEEDCFQKFGDTIQLSQHWLIYRENRHFCVFRKEEIAFVIEKEGMEGVYQQWITLRLKIKQKEIHLLYKGKEESPSLALSDWLHPVCRYCGAPLIPGKEQCVYCGQRNT